MRITIERLIDGDARVAPALAAAARMWRGLLDVAQRDQAFDLAAKTRDQQYAFEQACGDRILGKELYRTILQVFLERIEARRNRRH